MHERFTKIEAGSPISASKHMNPLMAVAGRYAHRRPGSYQIGTHNSHNVSESPLVPDYMTFVEIVDFKIDENDTEESGLFLVYERYYKPAENEDEEGEWMTNDQADRKFLLDATETPNHLLLLPKDKVPAYWNQQRGSFVSMFIPAIPLAGLATSNIANASVGTYKIQRMTPGGFVNVLDENDESVFKRAYNQSGITHIDCVRYRLDMFAASTFLSSYPYEVFDCS